jgi:c-di-GMP-binding flagellar brake protein YcgR
MQTNMARQTDDEVPEQLPAETVDLERFRTRNPHEINRVLRDLVRQSELATLWFGASKDFVLTAVIHVDSERRQLLLDYGADEDANRRLLNADAVQFMANHNRVRVQFQLNGLQKADFGGLPAFAAAFPESMIRIQRREFYRLTTPVATPLQCHFSVGEVATHATVVDISLGGIGLIEPAANLIPELPPGLIIEGCVIELPDEGPFETAIEIRNGFDVIGRSGTAYRRIGCRFLNTSSRMNAQIQRYIHRIELERRRHSLD